MPSVPTLRDSKIACHQSRLDIAFAEIPRSAAPPRTLRNEEFGRDRATSESRRCMFGDVGYEGLCMTVSCPAAWSMAG